MKTFTNLLTSIILAIWAGAIAILAVQNATSVSLKFFTFESIQMPVGVVLAFSAGVGAIGGAIAPLFWSRGNRHLQSEYAEEDFE